MLVRDNSEVRNNQTLALTNRGLTSRPKRMQTEKHLIINQCTKIGAQRLFPTNTRTGTACAGRYVSPAAVCLPAKAQVGSVWTGGVIVVCFLRMLRR